MKTLIYLIFSFVLIGKIQAQSWKELNAEGEKLYRTGKYAEAITIFEQTKIIAEKTLGKEHLNYAVSCNNLALLYDNQGFYVKAEALHIEAKSIYKKVLGKEHLGYALSCNNLANLYNSMALHEKAEPLYIEAKNIYEKVLGKEHPDYALSCNNLASLYKNQGFYSKAEPLFIEAKNIYEKILGKEHPDYATSCNNLAGLYQEQGHYSQAEPLYIESKSVREKVLGKEHPNYATSCNSLAGLYSSQGLYSKAEPLYIESKSIREKVLGKEHPDYATSCNNLGLLYKMLGFYAKAEILYIETKNIQEKVLGKEHPDYAISCNNLAGLYDAQGLYEKVEPLYIESRSIIEKILGKKHPDYAISCNNLASLYENQGLYSKSELLYIEAKSIYEKVFGKRHPSYARSCDNLGSLYENQNEFIKASSYYEPASQAFISQIENNFSTLSESEKGKFLNTFSLNLQFYNSFTIKANKQIPNLTAWAYNNSLVTKGLLFSSTQKIKERIQNSDDMPLKQLYEDWRIKKTAYSKALQLGTEECKKQNISTEKLQTEANELEKQLSQKSELFAKTNDKTRYTWQDVQKNLKKDEVIVEIIRTQYFDKKLTDSTLYMALIITPTTQNQPEMVVFSNGNEMEKEAVSYYKNAIKFKKQDKISYNAFWAQIKAKLGKAKKVYFVPDGVYHQINLVTLQNPTTKKYLRNEIQVQLLSSSKDLIKYAENSKKQRKNFKDYQIHLFGYPNYAQKNDKSSTKKEERSLSFSAKMDTTQRFFDPNSGVITVLEGTKVEINNISKILTDKNIKNTI